MLAPMNILKALPHDAGLLLSMLHKDGRGDDLEHPDANHVHKQLEGNPKVFLAEIENIEGIIVVG